MGQVEQPITWGFLCCFLDDLLTVLMIKPKHLLGGVFQKKICSFLFGEDFQIWRQYFSDGLVQPPTRNHIFVLKKCTLNCSDLCFLGNSLWILPWDSSPLNSPPFGRSCFFYIFSKHRLEASFRCCLPRVSNYRGFGSSLNWFLLDTEMYIDI